METSLFSLPMREPAECVIQVGGTAIDDLYPFLREVKVECSRAEASAATLVFETRRDEQGRWMVQDREVLVPWASIVISAAFGLRTEEIMRGFIREVRADYPESAGEATFTVECQDESIALDRQHMRRTWGGERPCSDREILHELTSKYSLRVDPDSMDGQPGLVLHQDGTDIRFLRGRAEANGYELLFQRGSVYFGPMRLHASPQPALLVYAGADSSCQRLSVKSDGHLPTKVAVDIPPSVGSNIKHREVSSNLALLGNRDAGEAPAGLQPFTWTMSRQGAGTESELVARAQRKANELAMRVQADGEVDGSIYGHVLMVGHPVGVDGAGSWLGGTYYVDTVSHLFNQDGYKQTIKLLRNAYGDNLGGGQEHPLAGVL